MIGSSVIVNEMNETLANFTQHFVIHNNCLFALKNLIKSFLEKKRSSLFGITWWPLMSTSPVSLQPSRLA